MSRPLVPLALSLALLGTLLSPSSRALACKCSFPSVEAAREDAAAVFEGRVLAIRETGDPGTMLGENHVTLAVVRSWKGLDHDERIEVVTSSSGASCGYTFARNASYLVYAQKGEATLHVSACSRTRPLADAAEDLKLLGAGSTPVRVVSRDAADAGSTPALDGSIGQGGAALREGRAPEAGTGPQAPAPRSRARGGCAGGSSAQAGLDGFWLALPALGMVIVRRRRRG